MDILFAASLSPTLSPLSFPPWVRNLFIPPLAISPRYHYSSRPDYVVSFPAGGARLIFSEKRRISTFRARTRFSHGSIYIFLFSRGFSTSIPLVSESAMYPRFAGVLQRLRRRRRDIARSPNIYKTRPVTSSLLSTMAPLLLLLFLAHFTLLFGRVRVKGRTRVSSTLSDVYVSRR